MPAETVDLPKANPRLDPLRLRSPLLSAICLILALALPLDQQLWAEPPAGYYDSVDESSTTALRQTLHEIVDDHIRFPYTASTTDTWDILNMADEDPNNPNNILDVYRNASYPKMSGGAGVYNREHSWPNSYGFPDDGSTNYAYTDCHHLFASDTGYNSLRGSKPFRYCNADCSENSTQFNDGRGGGSGTYAGNSNWATGSFSSGTWETWIGRRGDLARAMFYMDIRYEGGVHNVTGISEPDLNLTDNETLIEMSRTGQNESLAFMGMLSDLLQWHEEDPVDGLEVWRNDVVASFQGNRNPFIDHPEWVQCLYGNLCSFDSMAPAPPQGLVASGSNGSVDLSWLANNEADLAGYNVFRATTGGGPFGLLNQALVTNTNFSDSSVTSGTTYFYVVAAVDTSNNESTASNTASATPASSGRGLLLSEVLYDISGSDNGLEWVELYNDSSTTIDLSGYSLGNGGTSYTSSVVQLAGSLGPGQTFVVGGTSSNSSNDNPSFDQLINFNPDFQNSGSTADGVALFQLPAGLITSTSVPVDAVIYGGSNNSGLIDETGTANPPEVGDAAPGNSIERTDLAGAWQIQSNPTPNATPLGAANTAPMVSISTPSGGTQIDNGENLTFSASATDTEDGNLGSSLSWVSSLDGSIGNGATFSTTGLSVGNHTITAAVSDSGGLSANDTVAITVNEVSAPVTVVFTSIGSEDGWVRESTENSSVGGARSATNTGTTALRAGDHRRDRQYKGIASFDTSALPEGATLLSATARFRRGTVIGTTPFQTHGTCLVDIRSGAFGGSTALSNSDFQAAATSSVVATLSIASSNLTWSEGNLNSSGLASINTTGRTQLRIYFSRGDNDDRGSDYVGYYSGSNSNPAYHPQLVVTYQP